MGQRLELLYDGLASYQSRQISIRQEATVPYLENKANLVIWALDWHYLFTYVVQYVLLGHADACVKPHHSCTLNIPH